MEQVQELFSDPNLLWVLSGVTLMCTSSALVGTFTFLRKRALIGDAIAHAILPGVCLAFLMAQTKNPLILMLGAVLTGWLGLLSIDFLTRKTRLKSDAALALVLSVFYGVGIVLLTIIQKSGNAAQAGLDKFLFGRAAAIVSDDVYLFAGFTIILFAIIGVLLPSIKLVIFDREFARTRGLPVKSLEALLSVLTVVAIALGIQTVGVVLMSALLIAPAAAARYWTNRLGTMIFIAIGFSVLSGWAGTYISYIAPRMPTGPWIVSILSTFAILSALLGRRKGALKRSLQAKRNRSKMLQENILKCFYHLGEKDESFFVPRTEEELLNKRSMRVPQLHRGMRILLKKKLVMSIGEKWQMTEDGLENAKRIIRIHRLWELYLTTYLNLPADHVHDDADAIEHIITPEIEQELAWKLAYPTSDPHQAPIPYSNPIPNSEKQANG